MDNTNPNSGDDLTSVNPQQAGAYQHGHRRVQKVMNVELPVGNPKVIAARREESERRYPFVTHDTDEYVVVAVRRHAIGHLRILIVALITFVIVASLWILLAHTPNQFNFDDRAKFNINLIALSVLTLIAMGGIIGYSIYHRNKFIATNERILQWTVTGLFHSHHQTVNLEVIEDISFKQTGIFQHLFGYGTIRLSTVGEESTYMFSFVSEPSKHVELLGDIIENARENRFITDEMMKLGRDIGI